MVKDVSELKLRDKHSSLILEEDFVIYHNGPLAQILKYIYLIHMSS